jgi:hypothetical protein
LQVLNFSDSYFIKKDRDIYQALHGCILYLPRSKKELKSEPAGRQGRASQHQRINILQ